MLRLLSTLVAVTLAPAVFAQPLDPSRQQELRYLVRQDCGSCHGLTLKGGLGPAITPEALANRTAEGLAVIILDGIPDTAMPPWRPLLTEAEARWIGKELLKGLPNETR
jgi:cytochrome c55X